MLDDSFPLGAVHVYYVNYGFGCEVYLARRCIYSQSLYTCI